MVLKLDEQVKNGSVRQKVRRRMAEESTITKKRVLGKNRIVVGRKGVMRRSKYY